MGTRFTHGPGTACRDGGRLKDGSGDDSGPNQAEVVGWWRCSRVVVDDGALDTRCLMSVRWLAAL